jgi:lysozyme family protein
VKTNLDASLKLIFGHEGGYVNAKTDAGGPTKYGITHKTLAAHRGVKSVTAAQVKMMTLKEAEDIYCASYWGPSGGDVLPSGVDYAVFDFGVNSGPVRAVKTLQKVLRVPQDGWIGPQTIQAIAEYDSNIKLITDYCNARMAFLRGLGGKQGFSSNGRGWTIRVLGKDPKGQWKDQPGVIGNAIAMASKQPVKSTKPPAEVSQGVKDTMGATAQPGLADAYLKPDVLLPAAGAVATGVGGGGLAVLGNNWVLGALAFGIVVAVLVGAYYAIKRIRAAA